MYDIVSGGLTQPPPTRETAHRNTSPGQRTTKCIEERLTRLRREIMRLDDEIRFELSRRHPDIERVIELRDREWLRAEEVQALAQTLRGGRSKTPPMLPA